MLSRTVRNIVASDPKGDPRKLAREVLKQLPQTELIKILAHLVVNEQRLVVLAQEREVFESFVNRTATSLARKRIMDSSADSFRALLQSPFAIGDGQKVTWGQATIEQHQRRVMYLQKLRDGIDRTIEQHQAAIALLESSAASCLDDLESEAA